MPNPCCSPHARRPFSALPDVEHALKAAELPWNLPLENEEGKDEGGKNAPIRVSPFSYYSALLKQRCASLADGRITHDHIIRHGYDRNINVINCLGYFYGDLGAVREAHRVFGCISDHDRDEFSWNFLIRAYARDGQVREAFGFFHQMHREEIQPDKFSFVCLLSSCDDIDQGMPLHACIVEDALETENLVGNALISFYGKCGRLDEAQSSFETMWIQRDIVSWNSIISVYAQHGEILYAFSVFEQMLCLSIKPDKITFVSLLSVAADKSSLDVGLCMHMYAIDCGFSSERTIGNALVNLYGKCGTLPDARNVFESMDPKDIVSWNAILTSYVYNEEGNEALQLYTSFLLQGWRPNKVTLMSILDACASKGSVMEGRRVHTSSLCLGFSSDIALGTAIVHMYGECKGSQDDAILAFHRMPERNLFSWNTIIAMYAHKGEGMKASCMFERMQCESIPPNHVTFVSVVSACADQASDTLFCGKCIHSLIVISADFSADVVLTTSMLHMYGKHGCLKEAYKVFEEATMPNLVSWNAMVAAYSHQRQVTKVYELIDRMKQQGVAPDQATFLSALSAHAEPETLPLGKRTHACIVRGMYETDISIGNALINMYGECEARVDASAVFECMHVCNASSWNALVGAHVKSGHSAIALQAFHNMLQRECVMPDEVTYISVLDACLMELAMEKSKRFFACFGGSGLKLGVELASSFINVYGKCGGLRDAREVFDEGPKHEADTWNSMISAYAQYGKGQETLEMLSLMEEEGVAPNELTFVSVLTGCNHGGLILEGCWCFDSMDRDHGIKPRAEHYNCLIDMLGRVGRLDEANHLIDRVPLTCTALLSLLASCRQHPVDVALGERVSNLAIMADPLDCTPYIMMRNIYAMSCNSQDEELV